MIVRTSIKAGIACVVAASVLALAGCGESTPAVISQAFAAPFDSTGYFPSQFPSPEGPPEPHIEAF